MEPISKRFYEAVNCIKIVRDECMVFHDSTEDSYWGVPYLLDLRQLTMAHGASYLPKFIQVLGELKDVPVDEREAFLGMLAVRENL